MGITTALLAQGYGKTTLNRCPRSIRMRAMPLTQATAAGRKIACTRGIVGRVGTSAAPARRSLLPGDWAVLALLAERPAHGFALSQLLGDEGEVGQVWTMPRPRVYRAIDDLREAGLIETVDTEASERGPNRTLLAATRAGAVAVEQWLARPVAHVRDARSELLLKLVLTHRAGRDLRPLAAAQHGVLEELAERLQTQLDEADGARALVLRFRLAQTAAARDYVAVLLGE
jgi:PadR family transcriptional regulator AphA